MKNHESEEYKKKVMRTLEVYKPLYKEHMNIDIVSFQRNSDHS